MSDDRATSPLRAWGAVAWGTVRRILDDQITTVAAGVAFFVLLASFPGLAAVVSLVGLFVEPGRVDALLAAGTDVLPEGSAQVISRQINRLADAANSPDRRRALSLTPYIGFAILLWSTNKGTKALFRALNTIYEQEERRGLLMFTLVTLGFTLGTVIFLVFVVVVIVALPFMLTFLGLGDAVTRMVALLRWPVLLVVVGGAFALIYRYGPSRERQRAGWSAIALGSALAAILWLAISMLFSWYVSVFGGFAEIYGSLAAVIGFLIWIWLSVIAMLVGAEFAATVSAKGLVGTGEEHRR